MEKERCSSGRGRRTYEVQYGATNSKNSVSDSMVRAILDDAARGFQQE